MYTTNEFHSIAICPEDERNERKLMANKNERLPENVPGPYYVDATCIDCDLCRSTAPSFFRRHDEIGSSITYRQPVTAEEIQNADEALQGCPTESIGKDGNEAQ
jgi:ferredoxin